MNDSLIGLAVRAIPLDFSNTEDGEYLIKVRGVDIKIRVEKGKAFCPLCKAKNGKLYFSLVTGNILCYHCLTPVNFLFQSLRPTIENPLVVWLNELGRFRTRLLHLAKQSSLLYDTCRRLNNAATFFTQKIKKTTLEKKSSQVSFEKST